VRAPSRQWCTAEASLLRFTSGAPSYRIRASAGLSESCPKIGDVPKSPFPSVAALVPSAGTITLQIELRSARVPLVSVAFVPPRVAFRRAVLSKGKSHASTFNPARRIAEAFAARRSRRCRRNDVCWLLLGWLVARQHR